MAKKMVVPKPRATMVNEILRSKTGGRHQERQDKRSNRKSDTRREINNSLKGSKWNPFFCLGTGGALSTSSTDVLATIS
jgi:hypothetical protein